MDGVKQVVATADGGSTELRFSVTESEYDRVITDLQDQGWTIEETN